MWEHIQTWIHNRRVAVMRRGYYCLVPALAREGDVSAVVFGTSLPFMLRGAGRPGCYTVVGDAFVVSCEEIEWEVGEKPCSGYYASEDWMNMDLEEDDIWLC